MTTAGADGRDALDQVIASTLDERELRYDRRAPGRYFVTLPGVKKLQTNCWLILDRHALLVEAFVCRRPDEAHEEVYRYLLRRNARLYGVHYTIDKAGDIYLVGRIGLPSVTPDELDRVLGQVLEAADGDFNTLLELGFSTAIRREWDWRVSRGESLANLQPFRHLVEREEAGSGPSAVAE
ncbi:putative sensory transduction regulator [Streptoalloteichus tenebrarius]|uniref:Sensory transduction regulator n=1 Tax=Streptoalloteichus tenebrarius (strain ATCC 17920 / DSM 40477 / JCM 4838 / CBS 697.72 / NBRC 16177 / NCIMB 11028 / NRRL B-12390 / A12253. 1 / ISP 5477) TaxID=1933 RepID=A0ABT1I1R4_STRSD|nr:YbjN domain-containing protein [Streptoalloteichus tenebrarius]MCP2261699.1 putative sensory transduction regulator [Streptoalloteichus tenebrarius]BFF02410.1 YbjN domain-containing protein [Streptoalloteichus tenebrarius]